MQDKSVKKKKGPPTTEKLTQVWVGLPAGAVARVDEAAARRGVSRSYVIRQWVIHGIESTLKADPRITITGLDGRIYRVEPVLPPTD
jgi:Ribbon-helix-helix protein, copG family